MTISRTHLLILGCPALAAAAQSEYDAARAEMEREAKRAAKLDAKANVLVGGLQQREAALRAKLVELVEQLQTAQTELTCFKVCSGASLGCCVWRGNTCVRRPQATTQHTGVVMTAEHAQLPCGLLTCCTVICISCAGAEGA